MSRPRVYIRGQREINSCRGIVAAAIDLLLIGPGESSTGTNPSRPPDSPDSKAAMAADGLFKSEPVRSRSLRLLQRAMDTWGSSRRALSGSILPYYNTFSFSLFLGAIWSATKFHSFQKVLEY
jgi:hypothetical protein